MPKIWPRTIALVDMNAFFCSVEQIDYPEWQGRPIGITNGEQGTCIITCSYESRAYGVRTGMRLREAQRICPGFIRVPARPHRYAEVSANIMDALTSITPDVEVFSVDEAFLDLTRCRHLSHRSPQELAYLIKQTVLDASGGVLCSLGMSGDKSTAKYAAKLQKPNGLTLIPPWQAQEALADAPVTELCGIGRGIGRFLAERGVERCRDMQRLPIGVLARRFGNPGRRIWLMSQGLDPEKVETKVPAPKSIGHGKVMPPGTRDKGVIWTFLLHMAEKVAARLRRHHYCCDTFFIGLRGDDGWLGGKFRYHPPTNHGAEILTLCHDFLHLCWQGEPVHQVQITAVALQPESQQQELFAPDSQRRDSLNRARDAINRRYGEFAIAPGNLLKRSRMPNVIAPAWKPHGHRETIMERD